MDEGRLIARSALVDDLREELAVGGLALWGLPGVGKSWLARTLLPDAPPVDAAQLRDPDALRERLGEEDGDVVVIDGLDALLARDEPEVRRVLGELPVRALITTHRRRWTPPFAQAIAVRPLGLDEAMDLFLAEVARLHRPSEPTEDERAIIREVLPALDGLPRSVLWAAARWGVLGTPGLVNRLEGELPGPLVRDVDQLAGELDEADRRALDGLSTFAGSFSADDAETVLGEEVDDAVLRMGALHERALLDRIEAGRLRVPRAVRQIANVTPGFRSRHAAWCLARHPDPDRERPSVSQVGDLLEASRWLIDNGDIRVGTLLIALAAAAPGQHLELVETALDRVASPDVHRAHSRILRLRGRLEEAAQTLREGLALAGDDARLAGPLWRHWGVLHQTLGEWDEARAGYEQALECARELGDDHGGALATANLGAIDHDRCAYEDAEQRYADALEGLRAVDDPQMELTVRANQAVLWQELGKLEAAEAGYRQALRLLARMGHPHVMAVTLGNLGQLLHERSHLDEAEATLREALERLSAIEDPKTEALCLARLAAVHADLGRPDEADQTWEAASWAVRRADDLSRQVVELFGAFVDLVHGREAAARTRLEAAGPVLQWSGDARIAARILRQRRAAAPATLEVDDDGYVPPGGDRVDLTRHASIRRMFHALVQTARTPSLVLDVEALFAAGWPDERISPESMRNRVHVNLAKLRRWGLKTLIERTDEGYRLQATVLSR